MPIVHTLEDAELSEMRDIIEEQKRKGTKITTEDVLAIWRSVEEIQGLQNDVVFLEMGHQHFDTNGKPSLSRAAKKDGFISSHDMNVVSPVETTRTSSRICPTKSPAEVDTRSTNVRSMSSDIQAKSLPRQLSLGPKASWSPPDHSIQPSLRTYWRTNSLRI